MSARGEAQPILAGSHAEFITEHYTCVRGRCSEYCVEHPRWKIWNVDTFALRADVAALCGDQFVETLSAPPRSAFIADGSFIEIHARELF